MQRVKQFVPDSTPSTKPSQRKSTRSSFLVRLRGSVLTHSQDSYVRAQTAGELFYVRCSPRVFALFWLLILLLHAICAAYFSAACYLYLYIMPLSIGSNLRRYALRLTLDQYIWIAYAHAVFAVPHGFFILEMLFYSAWYRKFTFQSDTAARIASPKLSTRMQSTLLSSKWLEAANLKLFYWRKWLFGHTGLFGLGGQHFRTIVFVQEATEIVLQTTQAYRMSCWLPRVWLNRQYVALLVFNCWSTTVIQRFTGDNLPLNRLLVFLAGLLTDLVAIIGVPSILAYPYFAMYVPARTNFARWCWYDDAWLINMVNESQIILVTSVLDIAAKLVFSTTLLMTFMVVKSLLKPIDVGNALTRGAIGTVPALTAIRQSSASSMDDTITSTLVEPLDNGRVTGNGTLVQPFSVTAADLSASIAQATAATASSSAPISTDQMITASTACALLKSLKPSAILPVDPVVAAMTRQQQSLVFPTRAMIPLTVTTTAVSSSVTATLSPSANATRGPTPTAAITPITSTFAGPKYFAFQDRLVHWGHRLFLVWGVVVLLIQLHADNLPSPPLCGLQVRPWLERKPSCSLLQVDCYKLQLTGHATEIKTAMDAMNQPMLAHVVFRHCPNLQMPPNLQLLRRLIGFKIVNSTLTKWDVDAALTNTHHPFLTFMFMVRVNMTGIPLGLQTIDYPKRLTDVEYSITNLTTLPSDLHTKWPVGMVLVLEGGLFETVPETLKHMRVGYLALGENKLSSVPRELFTNPNAKTVWLNGNVRIATLPANLTVSPSLLRIRMVGTNISASSLPNWLPTTFLPTKGLVAGKSPLCQQIAALKAINGGTSSDMTALGEPWQKVFARVTCTADVGDDLSYYPRSYENKYNAGV